MKEIKPVVIVVSGKSAQELRKYGLFGHRYALAKRFGKDLKEEDLFTIPTSFIDL